jgi:NAD(P)H-dependent flavin oxidoreductase YrpB (nitropropane dioxygenase family)
MILCLSLLLSPLLMQRLPVVAAGGVWSGQLLRATIICKDFIGA